jgi:hypothetical protein
VLRATHPPPRWAAPREDDSVKSDDGE